MNPGIERLLWTASVPSALVALIVATVGSSPAPVRIDAPFAAPPSVASSLDSIEARGLPLGELALEVVARDPFRFERRPAAIPFGQPPEPERPPAPPAPRPALQLSGISGPPLHAVLEGVPGHVGGIIVHEGDTLAGLRIQSVRRDAVVVVGADTTWVLTLRRAW